MKQAFKARRFGADALAMIVQCDRILTSYTKQGYRMTLRQLYYRLVATDVIPNEVRSYKNLGTLVSEARLAGHLDWGAIEDRVRQPERHAEWSNLGDLVDAALQSYRRPRWADQDFYVELWVEKDALSGVLAPLADEYHITLMVNRGYSSQSAMYESARRFQRNQTGRHLVLLYLGDLDPSGEDMVRDVRDRLALFGVEVDVRKVALTMDQVKQYQPPPNPAKTTDSRYEGFAEKFGTESWEVDALPPNVLNQIIHDEMVQYVDVAKMDEVKAREERDKQRLQAAVEELLEEEEEEDVT